MATKYFRGHSQLMLNKRQKRIEFNINQKVSWKNLLNSFCGQYNYSTAISQSVLISISIFIYLHAYTRKSFLCCILQLRASKQFIFINNPLANFPKFNINIMWKLKKCLRIVNYIMDYLFSLSLSRWVYMLVYSVNLMLFPQH